MKPVILFLAATMTISSAFAAGKTSVLTKERSLKHVTSITKRPDGNFDILCMDGVQEIKTEYEITSNEVCKHITEDVYNWNQTSEGPEAGMRFCDFQTTTFEINGVFSYMSLKFEAPCNQTPILANSCTNKVCSLFIGTNEYNFDLSQAPGDLEVTRLSDGVKFNFK